MYIFWRQTDRQTDKWTDGQNRCALAIASGALIVVAVVVVVVTVKMIMMMMMMVVVVVVVALMMMTRSDAAEPPPTRVSHVLPPHEKLSPVKFMVAAGAHTWRPKTRHVCWKFTVVTLCAQLARDLLAIAKFLVRTCSSVLFS